MADKDKNGLLDFDEIQELHKKFLNNYGIKKLYEFYWTSVDKILGEPSNLNRTRVFSD